MPNIEEGIGKPKKELHIFYVLDTSYSMTGDPIGSLNEAMKNTIEELKKKDGEDADIRIAVLEYNTGARWVSGGDNGLENLQDFVWNDLKADGMTSLGAAMKELNISLSRNDKMKSATGNKIPIVIFMSDGYPTDKWEPELEALAKNKWYRAAIKIAFALGDGADKDVLRRVIGVKKDGTMGLGENVLVVKELKAFSDLIVATSVTASLAMSTSQMVNAAVDTSTIVKNAVQGAGYKQDPEGNVEPDPGVDVYPPDGGDGEFGALL